MEDSHRDTKVSFQSHRAPSRNERDCLIETMRPALALLWEAHRFAIEVSRDQWDFAVEIRNLRGAGVNESHLRWLVCQGLIEHAAEITHVRQRGRSFRPTGELIFTDTTCLILTPAGIEFAKASLSVEVFLATCQDENSGGKPSDVSQNGDCAVPHWDSGRHELRLGNQIIKQFKHRSPNQEMILAAFQEEGWPVSVRDPLSPLRDIDSKRRLNDTIKCLNHHQSQELIRFRGDGTGEGIIWERVPRNQNEHR